jgi:hypothetical protein
MTIRALTEPVYERQCDWCDRTVNERAEPWAVIHSSERWRANTRVGYHWHVCPGCVAAILAMRRTERPLPGTPEAEAEAEARRKREGL